VLALKRALTVARSWGATPGETRRRLPGDTFIPVPTQRATLAISIHAGPQQIWPWLAQMGKGRGGLYSYDWLDRAFGILDEPSSTVILPQFQELAEGDLIPVGKGGSFPVLAVEPLRHLVLGGGDDEMTVVWSFVLMPSDQGVTRLITRYQANYQKTLRNRFIAAALIVTGFLMTRRMLLNLRERAEALVAAESSARRPGEGAASPVQASSVYR